MLRFSIRPALTEDVISIAKIHYKALTPYYTLYARLLQEDLEGLLLHATHKAFEGKKSCFLVAEDDKQKTIGFIRWEIEPACGEKCLEPVNAKLDGQTLHDEERPQEAMFAPKAHLSDIWSFFCEEEEALDACYYDATKGLYHAYARHLAVDPQYQRMGVGSELLRAFVNEAASMKLPPFVSTSLDSYNICKMLGFSEIGGVVDHGKWMNVIEERESSLNLRGSSGQGSAEVSNFRELRVQMRM